MIDSKALFNISYGIFLLGTAYDGKINASINNTCMQVAIDPVRVVLACRNDSYTCELLKKSKKYALSIFDEKVSFDTIRRFGFTSGRDTDKFEGIQYKTDMSGMPYIEENVCAVLGCTINEMKDLGSHMLFICNVDDARLLNGEKPLTYLYYQTKIKPSQAVTNTAKEISPSKNPIVEKPVGWRCSICGYTYYGEDLPADFLCPVCGNPAEDFYPIYKNE